MSDPYCSCSRIYNPLVEPWLRPIKRQIVKECLQARYTRVLDLGCGTGTLLDMLRRAGIQAIGLDLSPSMLTLSREVFRGSPSLIRGRGEFLPFRSRSFEGVTISLMIHENPPLLGKAILKEALRILVPNGSVFILEYHRTSKMSGKMAGMVEYAVEWAAGREHFRYYRLFMEKGALAGFLSHLPPEKIRWQSAFFGSLALVTIPAVVQKDQSGQ